MFEKWQIKEHMEVTDSTGRHVGTIDHVDGDMIKLTRRESTDGRHHFIDADCIDRVEAERVFLKPGVPLPESFGGEPVEAQLGADAIAAGYAGQQGDVAKSDTPIFGTSGHGTGMGGSGTS